MKFFIITAIVTLSLGLHCSISQDFKVPNCYQISSICSIENYLLDDPNKMKNNPILINMQRQKEAITTALNKLTKEYYEEKEKINQLTLSEIAAKKEVASFSGSVQSIITAINALYSSEGDQSRVMNNLPSKKNNQLKEKCLLDKIKIFQPFSPEEGLLQLSQVLKQIACEFVSFTNNMVQSVLDFIPDVFSLRFIKDDTCNFIFTKHEIMGISYDKGAHVFYTSPSIEKEINENKKTTKNSKRIRYFGGLDPRNEKKRWYFSKLQKK